MDMLLGFLLGVLFMFAALALIEDTQSISEQAPSKLLSDDDDDFDDDEAPSEPQQVTP